MLKKIRAVIDAILLVAVAYVLGLLLTSAVRDARVQADVRVVEAEARALYEAFNRYHERNHRYPGGSGATRFDPETLAPVSSRGYYAGRITDWLLEGRIDAYDSPDDLGRDQEFWIEMTVKSDPTIRFLIARSNDAPMGGGEWRDGVFIFRTGSLDRI